MQSGDLAKIADAMRFRDKRILRELCYMVMRTIQMEGVYILQNVFKFLSMMDDHKN